MPSRSHFPIRRNNGNYPTRNLPGNAAWNGQSMRASRLSQTYWPECETLEPAKQTLLSPKFVHSLFHSSSKGLKEIRSAGNFF
jgi:hypothetical protein